MVSRLLWPPSSAFAAAASVSAPTCSSLPQALSSPLLPLAHCPGPWPRHLSCHCTVTVHHIVQDKEGVFPLRPELFSSLGEEELTLTEALVGLSGLEVQRSGPQYTWDPDTLPRLCALYAGLSLLQLLTKAS